MANEPTPPQSTSEWDRQPTTADGQPAKLDHPELRAKVADARRRLGSDADYDTVISDLRNQGVDASMEEVTTIWDPSDK